MLKPLATQIWYNEDMNIRVEQDEGSKVFQVFVVTHYDILDLGFDQFHWTLALQNSDGEAWFYTFDEAAEFAQTLELQQD